MVFPHCKSGNWGKSSGRERESHGITPPPINVPRLSTFALRVSLFARYLFFVPIAILLLLPLELHATTCTTVQSGAWSSLSVWVSGIVPQAGDTAVIGVGDSVWLDESTPALAYVDVQGSFTLGEDTLFLQPVANAFDTLVTIQGTLDASSGWFGINGAIRPVVHCEMGSLFRTSVEFPVSTLGIFDSSASPLFALDTASTFEYYSLDNALIDVSYLLNNIIGHAYRNLTLTGTVASFYANPLVILGTLHIGFGASTTAENPTGIGIAQTITLSGDVINDNTGPSGAPGAGRTGCGMLSLGEDTWIFDALPHGTNVKDTIHWSGPSQVGTVVVTPHTVLSVRFVNDSICDSLDLTANLIEEGAPCGGHLIGRVYSQLALPLDSMNPVDSFNGLGLTITSGTKPYLGLTKVIRTSGYAPPNTGVVTASVPVLPVLRYYRIIPGDGPQTGSQDAMSMQIHCDELNGTDPTALHFWRSPDQGNTWAYSGLTSYNDSSDVFVWDTTVLGWPNGYGSFLWMLANGYTDTPLPVTLQNFTAQWFGTGVELTWQTSSENGVLGFEIDRADVMDSEFLTSYWTDDSLRARSQYGATYQYMDAAAPTGTPRYDLYEISDNGARVWLASRVATAADSTAQPGMEDVWYNAGSLTLSFYQPPNGTIAVADAIGRVWFQHAVNEDNEQTLSLPVALPEGFYFVSYRSITGAMTKKLLVAP